MLVQLGGGYRSVEVPVHVDDTRVSETHQPCLLPSADTWK